MITNYRARRAAHRKPTVRALAAIVLSGATLVGAAVAATQVSASTGHDSAAYDWPQLHASSSLQGWASNSPITTANASQLGLGWTARIYGAALDSPVAAYDASLGETLVYVGTETGYFLAVAMDTGKLVWSDWLGAPIRGTAAVTDGVVYVDTAVTPRVYALDATTGAVVCSLAEPNSVEGSFGVATPPGGVPSVYIGVEDSGPRSGPVIALQAGGCDVEWQFTGYAQESGPWDPMAYGVDAGGVPLVVFGTADPDSGVYALNALTGAEVWRFGIDNPSPGTYDVGAGVVVSAPGVNGIADGVAYVPTKYGVMYALDLTTGAKLWSYTFDTEPKDGETGISTAALDGTQLVFGGAKAVTDLDAATGALDWSTTIPAESTSSPAIAGPAGSEVVATADLTGAVRVLSLATGAQLYSYQTGGYITGSPAVDDGNILIASSDGYLYDFVVGGGNETGGPATTISSPADGSTLANPASGSVRISGNATDPTGVSAVDVAVQSGGATGTWWDAATSTWSAGPTGNAATLSSAGATSTNWSINVPVASGGGTYHVVANSVSSTGKPDLGAAVAGFTVKYSTKGPHVEVSPTYAAPGSSVKVSGGGFTKGEKVAISLLGTTLATATASTTTTSFGVTVTIPTTTPAGDAAVVATGQTSGKSSSAGLYVTNSWTQGGYGSTRTGYEPNDLVLADLVKPGGNIFVDMAWALATTSAANTSPVVSDGVAYVGEDSGQIVAVDVHNGSVLWTWQDSTGAAITGSPAIDAAGHLLFAGAADGNLYALSTTTGALAWTDAVGGDLTAPAFTGSDVYASSSTGAVVALATHTGSPVWSATMPAAATAPAVDPSVKDVFVADAAGDLDALSTATGASVWTASTGSSISAPPLASGDDVFVGGASGDLDAFAEKTGAAVWSTTMPAAVGALATVSGKNMVVGGATGDLDFVAKATGAIENQISAGSSIVGIAATQNVVVISMSDGKARAFRTVGNDIDLWSEQVTSSFTTSPAIVNGTIYLAAGTSGFQAYTPYGAPPP